MNFNIYFFWRGGGGQKMNIFLCFQKNEYFWGYDEIVDIFWGSSQNWTYLGAHFYTFYGQ